MKNVIDPVAELNKLIERHGSQMAVAERLGVSSVYISDLVNGRRDFSERMLEKLGLVRVVVKGSANASMKETV